MYQAFSKKGTLFKGDITQGGTLFKEIRYADAPSQMISPHCTFGSNCCDFPRKATQLCFWEEKMPIYCPDIEYLLFIFYFCRIQSSHTIYVLQLTVGILYHLLMNYIDLNQVSNYIHRQGYLDKTTGVVPVGNQSQPVLSSDIFIYVLEQDVKQRFLLGFCTNSWSTLKSLQKIK